MNADSLLTLAVRVVDTVDRALRRARTPPTEQGYGRTDEPPPGLGWHQREAWFVGVLAVRTKQHSPWKAAKGMPWKT